MADDDGGQLRTRPACERMAERAAAKNDQEGETWLPLDWVPKPNAFEHIDG